VEEIKPNKTTNKSNKSNSPDINRSKGISKKNDVRKESFDRQTVSIKEEKSLVKESQETAEKETKNSQKKISKMDKSKDSIKSKELKGSKDKVIV